jgi:DNA-binding XRE family transcriptional regulator
MCLRFVFLLITRSAGWLWLSRRETTWKTAEILILHHQLIVLQQRQPCRPKLNWANRALFAALLSVVPKARRHRLRLLVTPDTILRWRRDIVRRRWAARSARGRSGRPATRRSIQAGQRRKVLMARQSGYQLAEERKRHGLTQAQLAKAMGVTPGRVSQIERGELATIDAVARYVEALGGQLDLIASFGDHTLTVATTDAA